MALNHSVHCRAFSSPPGLLPCLLGVLDGSIQGAEEGSTFLHHTVEMHLVEKVTLGIAEILGAKPGQKQTSRDLREGPRREVKLEQIFFFCVFQFY